MKKVTALVLATLLVFVLAGCGDSEQEAYALYMDAADQLVSTGSFAADADVTLTFTHSGQDTCVPLSGTVKGEVRDIGDFDVSVAMSARRAGAVGGVNGFYTDGWAYVSALGARVKAKTDVTGAFPESAVKGAVVQQVNGGSRVTFTLDGAGLEAVLGTRLPGLRSIGLANGADIRYGDTHVEAFIGKDGALKTLDANITFTLVVDGETVAGSASLAMEVTQMGGVRADLPADPDSYREITA